MLRLLNIWIELMTLRLLMSCFIRWAEHMAEDRKPPRPQETLNLLWVFNPKLPRTSSPHQTSCYTVWQCFEKILVRIRLRKSFIAKHVCLELAVQKVFKVFIATVTNFCHTVALFRYEQVLKSHSNFHQRHSCLIMKLLLQVQKHSRLERTSARQVYF